MSTIAVDNAKPSLGGTATNLMKGLSKASVTYDHVVPETDDSYNVSGVTDVGVGIYLVGITNLFAAATYQIGGLAGLAGASIERSWLSIEYDTPPTTSAYQIAEVVSGNTLADLSYSCSTCIGDLA